MTINNLTPVDVSDVRDSGMRALILLAASLGWNVVQKLNNPVLLIARDGTQRRVPTNTSIRMSVFQSVLSGIITHSEVQPSADLVEQIIDSAKLDRDHARRLRHAIDETPEEHEQHLAAAAAEPQGPREPQPVTQRIEVPDLEWVEPSLVEHHRTEPTNDPPPFDGRHHGKLSQVGPFMAAKTGPSAGGGSAYRYESEALLQRNWEDGYVDYLCKVCRDFVVASPRAIGTHRSMHIRAGEAVATVQKYRSARKVVASPKLVAKGKPVPAFEAAEPLIDQIIALVSPALIVERDKLAAENEQLRAENKKLADNLKALKDLVSGL